MSNNCMSEASIIMAIVNAIIPKLYPSLVSAHILLRIQFQFKITITVIIIILK